MNKYLLPMTDDSGVWIESVIAKSLNDSEDKFMRKIIDEYDEYNISDYSWDEFIKDLEKYNIFVGNIYNIEEFE